MLDKQLPPRNHNNPPDPIDQINADFEAVRLEAENWLDGTAVENEGQMKAVDELRKGAREWRLSLERGQKSATAPLYDAYKAEGERWKPTIEDAKRIEAGLVSALDAFKRKLAEAKEAAERQARMEAAAKARAAQEAAQAAAASNLEAQRAAAEAQREAEEAQRRAVAAAKEKVTGLRTVQRYQIEDHRAALHDIASNDREAVTAFIEDYVRRNFKARPMKGVRVWQEREAY